VDFNPSSVARVCVRSTNWLGDAVMSLPAIRAIRKTLPHAGLALVARPGLAGLFARESAVDRVIPYPAPSNFAARRAFAAELREQKFDCAILLQNAFDAALIAWMAAIPERIGYGRDGRRLLLTRAIPVPEPGDIPRHERFYYLELLRCAGIIDRFPACDAIALENVEAARRSGGEHLRALGIAEPVIGISPGAAYGNAKRWMSERFAECGRALRPADGTVLVFGSAAERELAETVARAIPGARNLAGQTTLREFIDLVACCRLFLCNDSGAMHVASALGVPTIAVFGATDDVTTGPTGSHALVVREHAECSPCLLRECPIDHRCMARVTAERVIAAAEGLCAAPAFRDRSIANR
jgi:heptosyltransferase-2